MPDNDADGVFRRTRDCAGRARGRAALLCRIALTLTRRRSRPHRLLVAWDVEQASRGTTSSSTSSAIDRLNSAASGGDFRFMHCTFGNRYTRQLYHAGNPSPLAVRLQRKLSGSRSAVRVQFRARSVSRCLLFTKPQHVAVESDISADSNRVPTRSDKTGRSFPIPF